MAQTCTRRSSTVSIGLRAGLVGSITIWVYELVVFCVAMHTSTASGVVEHTALLVFGPAILARPQAAFGLGALIHCATGVAWGIVFAAIWPALRRLHIEASLAGLIFGAIAWVVMHNVVLALFSPAPPQYTPEVVINGLMSHMVAFSVPLALVVKRLHAHDAP